MIKKLAGVLEKGTILISRTDGIGDVVLTLPLVGWLKKQYPHCRILFLGRKYTLPVLQSCHYIDEAIAWDEDLSLGEDLKIKKFRELDIDVVFHVFPNKEIARIVHRAKIPYRVGSSHRWWHWKYANVLVPFSRKKSVLHEAELNFFMLSPFAKGFPDKSMLQDFYGLASNDFTDISKLLPNLDPAKPYVLLHPLTRGSAREWGLDHFVLLANRLKPYANVIVTGSKEEGEVLKDSLLLKTDGVFSLCGMINLNQLMGVISRSSGLVAASTGPLHLAAALGVHCIGLYPPIKPMHPGRWAPLGKQAVYLSEKEDCRLCRNDNYCSCMRSIAPEKVASILIRKLNPTK